MNIRVHSIGCGFNAGPVVEGEPTMDFRSTPRAVQLSGKEWCRCIMLNAQMGQTGAHHTTKSETRIAVALRSPTGRVFLSGLIKPTQTRAADGSLRLKEPTLQGMGYDQGGARIVFPSGRKPALLEDCICAGLLPFAILHFAEVGYIFQAFPNQITFDLVWAMTPKTTGRKIKPPDLYGTTSKQINRERELQRKIDELAAKVGVEENEISHLYGVLRSVVTFEQQQFGSVGDNVSI